ncbi:MAG: DUF3054 domain-containing protein [Pseudonocardia sp.]
MSPSRIPGLAVAADMLAVVVFVAVGRLNHDASGALLGFLATLAPFAVGLLVSWATPVVRVNPAGLRAGAVVLAGTAVVGLALRAAFTDQLPLTFAVVTVVALGLLLLGWRGLAAAVARKAAGRPIR